MTFPKISNVESLDPLSHEESTEHAYFRFQSQFDKIRTNKGGKKIKSFTTCSLICILFRSFWSPILSSSILKLFNIVFTYLGVVAVKFLLNFIEDSTESQLNGYMWVSVLFVSLILRGWALQLHYLQMYKCAIRIRAALMAAVYRKGLNLSPISQKTSSIGEIVNLMSVDATRIIELAPFLHDLWSSPLQISIGLYFLYDTVKLSFLAGVAVFFVILLIGLFASAVYSSVQEQLMKKKDERMKLFTEVLNAIKLIKWCAWELLFYSRIKQIRNQEMKHLKKVALLNLLNEVAWTCTAIFACLSIFGTYIALSEDRKLNGKVAFLVITIFSVMYIPLYSFPICTANILTTIVSMRRLAKFFSSNELSKYCEINDKSSSLTIEMQDVSFSWEKSTILKHLNLNVGSGSLVAIVGSVGSGKSSLLNAISGEMTKLSGRIFVNDSLAYVPQQAWIQNMTIRENIVFGKEYEPIFYQQVVDACSLEQDFALLPGGDLAEAGERGLNLSGGQKQRISLARSVYQNSEIYLLDDPLSAVDVNVGNQIFEKVIGPLGLLGKKTRIFVTHGLNFLHFCDLVVVMKDGRFVEIGTFKQNCEREGGAFNELLKQIIQKMPKEESLQELDQVTLDSFSPTVRDLYEQKKRLLSERSKKEEIDCIKPNAPQNQSSSIADISGGKLIEEEQMSDKRVPYSVYMLYAKAGGCWFWIHVLFLLLMQSANLGANIWLELWTDYQFNYTLGLGLYGYCCALILFLTIVYSFAFVLYQTRAAKYLHEKLTFQIFRAPMSFFDTTPAGRILNRCGRDINTIDHQIPMSFSQVASFLWIFAQSIIAIVYSIPLYVLPLIPMIVIYGYLQKRYVRSSRQYRRLEAITRSPVYSFFQETILGCSTIRAFNQKQRFFQRSDKLTDTNNSAYLTLLSAQWYVELFFLSSLLKYCWINFFYFIFLGIYLQHLGALMVGIAALMFVIYKPWSTFKAGQVGLAISFVLSLADLLDWGVGEMAVLETEIVALERINEYINMPTEAEWSNELSKSLKVWPTNGVVEFQNYSTSYRQGLDLVLKNICVSIGAGEKIGVVGRTGAGKSSLSLALFRMLEPVEGKIIIDDIDICRVGLHDLRSRLAIIPQDPLLFSGTLRTNLDPFRIHSDKELWHALEISHMKSYVLAQPSHLMFDISEGGVNLSAGQRQLICLARAFLRQAKILLLDEATATVDTVTDVLIQETIRDQFQLCTVITIAHRLNTIMDSDKVLVLQQGQLIEYGRPEVLMKNYDSVFAKMVKESHS